MIVEIKRSHIIKTLLDTTEPLTWGTFGTLSAKAEKDWNLDQDNTDDARKSVSALKENCQTCAVGCVIRSILSPDCSVLDMSHIANYTSCYRPSMSYMYSLEKFFEGEFTSSRYSNKDGSPNMRCRRRLVRFVENKFPVWVPVDVNGLVAEKLTKAKVIRIQK